MKTFYKLLFVFELKWMKLTEQVHSTYLKNKNKKYTVSIFPSNVVSLEK